MKKPTTELLTNPLIWLAVGLIVLNVLAYALKMWTANPPPEAHPAPTLHFDAFTDLNANTGFYGNGDGEIIFSCNGEIVKREEEFTREDLLALINTLITGDFGYFESLCPAPPPIRFEADCQTGIWTDEQIEWMKGKTCAEIEALGGVPSRWSKGLLENGTDQQIMIPFVERKE